MGRGKVEGAGREEHLEGDEGVCRREDHTPTVCWREGGGGRGRGGGFVQCNRAGESAPEKAGWVLWSTSRCPVPCHLCDPPVGRGRLRGGGGGTGRSGRQKAATRPNMRRVTVQGPVKKQQPDGMSHRGDSFVGEGGMFLPRLTMATLRLGACPSSYVNPPAPLSTERHTGREASPLGWSRVRGVCSVRSVPAPGPGAAHPLARVRAPGRLLLRPCADQVGVPISVARILTFPERVTVYNIDQYAPCR